MIGRSTRVLDQDPLKPKAWCRDKDKFLIIDCWGNFEFFQNDARWPGPKPASLSPC